MAKQLQAAVVIAVEVFIAARGPTRIGILEVVHDAANVGAGAALAVVARVSSRSVEVVVHSGVVANFMGHNLNFLDSNYNKFPCLEGLY